jgi:hypothetical protein
MIGINSQGFVADVDRFNDVWNQPVSAYTSEIVAYVPVTENEARSGVKTKLQMKTIMIYGEELVFRTPKEEAEGTLGFVSKDPVTNTPAQTTKQKTYEYVLELNVYGQITGGSWISETRPDMLWTKKRDVKFLNGKFPLAGLNVIYKPVNH